MRWRWLHLRNRIWNVYVAARYAWRYGVEDKDGWPVFPCPVAWTTHTSRTHEKSEEGE